MAEASNTSEVGVKGTGITVRPARPADMIHLARLLPGALQFPSHLRLFVASAGESAGVAGAGALAMLPGAEGQSHGVFQVEVMSGDGAKETAAALLRVLMSEARSRGATTLAPSGAVMEESLLVGLLESEGFERKSEVTWYETELKPMWATWQRLYKDLQDRDAIPETARFISLDEAPEVAVMQLIENSIGGEGNALEAMAWGGAISREHSLVAMDGPKVAGVLMIGLKKPVVTAHFLAIDESHRAGWVYVCLERETHRRLMSEGYTTWHYKTNPGIDEKIARGTERLDHRVVGKEVGWVLTF